MTQKHGQGPVWRRGMVWALVAGLLYLVACGRPGDPPPLPEDPELEDDLGGLDETAPDSEPLADRGSSEVVLASPDATRQGLVVPRSYLVAFRAEPGASLLQFASFDAEGSHYYQPLAASYLSDPRIVSIQYLTAVNLANPVDPRGINPWKEALPVNLWWDAGDLEERPAVLSEVDFASQDDAAAVIGEWQAAGDIWYAEPNYTSELYNTTDEALENVAKKYREMEKNELKNFSFHQSIKLAPALEVLAKVPKFFNPVIAVLDSGVDVQHPALKDRIWKNPYAGQTGCGNDEWGCDTTKAAVGSLGRPTSFPYSTDGHGKPCTDADFKNCVHGTHVAGIVAAYQEEGGKTKVAGVCPVCKILPIKIIAKNAESKKGQATDAAILRGLKYLTRFADPERDRSFIRVANSSFGKYPRSRSVALLVRVLSSAPNEILVVGAAGNEDSMKRSYPAAYPEAIAVASITSPTNQKSDFSNYGPWVDIAAPGDSRGGLNKGILSIMPGGNEHFNAGTSMAAPVVAGVAGLLLATPEGDALSFDQLRSRIVDTADPSVYDAGEPKNDTYYRVKLKGDARRTPLLGGGLVDAEAVLLNKTANLEQAELAERVEALTCGTVSSRPPRGEGPRLEAARRAPIRGLAERIMLGLLLLTPAFVVGYLGVRRSQI